MAYQFLLWLHGGLLYYTINQHAEFIGSHHLLWPNKFCLSDTYRRPSSTVSPGYASVLTYVVLLDSVLLPQSAFCTHTLIPLLHKCCPVLHMRTLSY